MSLASGDVMVIDWLIISTTKEYLIDLLVGVELLIVWIRRCSVFIIFYFKIFISYQVENGLIILWKYDTYYKCKAVQPFQPTHENLGMYKYEEETVKIDDI